MHYPHKQPERQSSEYVPADQELELSPREREIVKLLSEGHGSKQIADALFISPHTVDTHRRNLIRHSGAKNTLELAIVCLRKGLI